MNHNGHVLKYTTGSLEFVQSGPVFVKSIEYLRVNRVGRAQSLKVFVGLGLHGELIRVLPVEV